MLTYRQLNGTMSVLILIPKAIVQEQRLMVLVVVVLLNVLIADVRIGAH